VHAPRAKKARVEKPMERIARRCKRAASTPQSQGLREAARPPMSPLPRRSSRVATRAPVAQLDRAPDYESGGQRFESFRARHFHQEFTTPEGGEECLLSDLRFSVSAGAWLQLNNSFIDSVADSIQRR
jgi:hypothetical protein